MFRFIYHYELGNTAASILALLYLRVVPLLLLLTCPLAAMASGARQPDFMVPATEEELFRVPLNPQEVDKAVLESQSRPFDARIWATDVSQRRYMLVDLLRRIAFMKGRKEILALIGEPDRIGNEFSSTVDYFELGKLAGESIILKMHTNQDSAPLFMIGQYSKDGYLQLLSGNWRWTNPDLKDAARDMNRLYYFVGAPREHLCQFIGHPPNHNRSWIAGYMQVELTDDKSKVKRFRFVADKKYFNTVLTAWEDKDLRRLKGSYTKPFDFLFCGENIDRTLIHPGRKYDSISWKQVWDRPNMLFDLIHSNPLIGKTRSEIQNLLGVPYYSEAKPSTDKRQRYFVRRMTETEPLNRFDWFDLRGTGCVAPAEPGLYLEVVYTRDLLRGDIAAGYRLLASNKYDDGVKEIFGKIISKDVGYCQPLSQKSKPSQKLGIGGKIAK